MSAAGFGDRSVPLTRLHAPEARRLRDRLTNATCTMMILDALFAFAAEASSGRRLPVNYRVLRGVDRPATTREPRICICSTACNILRRLGSASGARPLPTPTRRMFYVLPDIALP